MLFSPTRPVTPESSWVPGRLPRPTRHPISFFFLRCTHKYCSMVISFFFPSPYTQVLLYSSRFFFPSPYTQIQLVPSLFFPFRPRLT